MAMTRSPRREAGAMSHAVIEVRCPICGIVVFDIVDRRYIRILQVHHGQKHCATFDLEDLLRQG